VEGRIWEAAGHGSASVLAMARPTLTLIDALRETAQRLDAGAEYAWTHMGRCNCGHLVQTVTSMAPGEIHARMLEREGDWAEQATEFSEHPPRYCVDSGYAWDHVLDALLDLGMSTGDVADLERLRNEKVRRRLPDRGRGLSHRDRSDVAAYMSAWADLLEEELDAAAGRNPEVDDAADVARRGAARATRSQRV